MIPSPQNSSLNQISLTVNGEAHTLSVPAQTTLLSLLRDHLYLKGTKEGCGEGDCGACTVLLDGRAVNSCLVLAVEAQGRTITTIEGLSTSEKLHPIQEAFVKYGAVQCGFCTPGMVMNACSLLNENPQISREELKLEMAGNLCRCTGYSKILQALLSAQKQMSISP